jgi:hypothetical protein
VNGTGVQESLCEIPCSGPDTGCLVIPLERLLEAQACRRLPWWRAQGFAPTVPGPEAALPSPWPDHPPGWQGPGKGWGRPFLDAPPEWGLTTRADWLLDRKGIPELVFLGPPTPTLRFRARLTATLVMLRGNSEVKLGWQGWPCNGASGTWLGEWPRVLPLRLPLVKLEALAASLDELRHDLDHPWPPARSTAKSHCWDCPASRLCADFY